MQAVAKAEEYCESFEEQGMKEGQKKYYKIQDSSENSKNIEELEGKRRI